MSAWITVAASDLNTYLVSAQVSAIRTAATAPGQTDRFAEAMPTVINRIRKNIESCVRNKVSATPLTIPAELKWVACYLIIEELQAAIPGLKLTTDQQTKIKDAKDDLLRIAKCDLVVTAPDDPLNPDDAQRGGQVQVASKSCRRATRESLRGL